jgi:hypothetical protein
MYRYNVDKTVTYTAEDILLFRESPFAAWMERLTLENPEHGVSPDPGSSPPSDREQRQDTIAAILTSGGRDVVLIEWDAAESSRRSQTVSAMRSGAEFIVNGQLALGPLAASSQLLMRTRGYSELGNHLYVPCDVHGVNKPNSTFRLCFLADLLHSLQGVLPPNLVLLRAGQDTVNLNTGDHIYHYRAVKQRFMAAQGQFRKHRMPDPAVSLHFGRWAECANQILRQRAAHDGVGAAQRTPLLGRSQDADADAVQSWSAQPAGQASPSDSLQELDMAVNSSAPLAAMNDATLQGLEFIGSVNAAAIQGANRAGQAGDRRRRALPSVMLGESGAAQASAVAGEPLAHPLDSAGFSVAHRASPLPSSTEGPLPSRLSAQVRAGVDRDDDGPPRRFTPVPFSASLNTRDSFEG